MAVNAREISNLVDSALTAGKKAEDGDSAEQVRAVDILKLLKKQSVSAAVLAESQAGKRLRALIKHPDVGISSAASEAIAAWKELIRGEATIKKEIPSGSLSLSTQKDRRLSASQSSLATSAMQHGARNDSITDLIPKLNDSLRDKVRSNLATALAKAVEEGECCSDAVLVDTAVKIEEEIFKTNSGVTPAYKAKFRQLHFNLKDDKNPDLRRKVVSARITPDLLVTLTPEDLASDVQKEENAKIREKKLFDSAPAAAKQATTDQFQCGKCKQRKCTYYQMQTRSADEPMTTFVSCLNCNNRWKFC